jgi:hypothetical protein
VIFVGIDWAEHHHDVCLVDAGGQVLATGRLPDGVQGVSRLHELVATHAEDLRRWSWASRPTAVCWWVR